MFRSGRRAVAWMLLSGLFGAPLAAAEILQCVPYARVVSGIQIRGDAHSWWDQAADRYKRGHEPRKGAVLAFRASGPMTLGHVAVVSKILDDRRILIRHANWSGPGMIEEDVEAIDVSPANDWSEVRVWWGQTHQMGARINPAYGFIYGPKKKLHDFAPERDMPTVQWTSAAPPGVMAPSVAAKPVSAAVPARVTYAQAEKAIALNGVRVRDHEAARDPFIVEYASAGAAPRASGRRTLSDIIADVREEAEVE